jgi:hypothetical protein
MVSNTWNDGSRWCEPYAVKVFPEILQGLDLLSMRQRIIVLIGNLALYQFSGASQTILPSGMLISDLGKRSQAERPGVYVRLPTGVLSHRRIVPAAHPSYPSC